MWKCSRILDPGKGEEIPKRTSSETLLLVTWNLREFGHRLPESLYYIAEILSLFDLIAFKVALDQLQLGASKPNAGTFDVFKTVFQDAEWRTYYDLLGKNRPAAWEKDGNGKALTDAAKKEFFVGTWRTYQMSDHFPMWVELKVDFADA